MECSSDGDDDSEAGDDDNGIVSSAVLSPFLNWTFNSPIVLSI